MLPLAGEVIKVVPIVEDVLLVLCKGGVVGLDVLVVHVS
jgi:hypothetical protein